jgi:hypothetical protein
MLLLPVDRLTRKVFDWDVKKGKCWSLEVKDILSSVNLAHLFESKDVCELRSLENKLYDKRNSTWNELLISKPKLRSYVKFKKSIGCERYLFIKNRRRRSLLAEIRFGILPLHIETGRFRNVKVEERLCEICKNNFVEDEVHFICVCPSYDDQRQVLFNSIDYEHFNTMSIENKFVYLMEFESNKVGIYMEKAWEIRKNIMYNTGV